ncbi:hypothetical protein J4E89_001678 [Alternaria sp. Ai002NY15]|nr:hypothetical protein J4E89_001678 [Alternaria sp. Ai002NY15]
MLPSQVVLRSLKALPAPILDNLKERVFATAVRVGDIDLVSTMLGLNMDPREKIMMDWPSESKPTYPIQFAVAEGHFAVAKALTSNMCRGATQSQFEELIDHICEGVKDLHSKDTHKLSESERTELMCIALRAGARPHCNCLGTNDPRVSVKSLKQLLEASTAGVIAWLEAGLLKHYFAEYKNGGPPPEVRISLAIDVLQFVLSDKQHHLPTNDPRLKTAMFGALDAALNPHHERAVEMILKAFSFLGYHLDDDDAYVGDSSAHGFMDRSILDAFDDTNWNLAASLMIAKRSMANSDMADPWHEQKSQLQDAIQKSDPILAFHLYTLLSPGDVIITYGQRMVELALRHRDSAMAITIIENMSHWSLDGLIIMLSHGQIMAVSTLLGRNPIWKDALEAASGHKNFEPLETMFFYGFGVPIINFETGRQVVLQQVHLQLCFRATSYHCMATNDYEICQWLLKIGMDPDELYVNTDDEISIEKGSGLHCSLPGGIGVNYFGSGYMLPSLLAVAAERNHIDWMKFLAANDVSVVDSMALLQAIKSRATIATVRFLLDAAKARESSVKRSYGVAALRQAIRYRDINRIDILCSVVNVDEIEPFNEEFMKAEPAISPLGEAIIADDSEITRVLLKHGASPNAYVSFDGLKMLKHIKSHIQRVTPLLAAIDVQCLPLVKILVEHGAELQYTRNMGVTRTPLQRAAETGSFDIVECLVNQGAIIDTVPVYSGGTALQLAAMNGFCGIVAFLLEHGADPNYPPAKGNGRTAFEAAAEWAHVDTMSLLMQWNVNLDAQFGEPPESQYERARRFAEKNGFMASKRFVEHLYGQRTRDESWPAGLALDSM